MPQKNQEKEFNRPKVIENLGAKSTKASMGTVLDQQS